MVKTFFLNSIRALFKDRVFTLTGFIGLIVGNAVFVVIGVWVFNNLTFDKSFARYDRIFRVTTEEYVDNNLIGNYANTYEGVRAELPSVFPEVVASTKFYTLSEDDIQITYTSGAESSPLVFNNFTGVMTDSSFFRIFSFEFIAGRKEDFTRKSVVITEKTARRYFGDHWNSDNNSPLGKPLKIFDGSSFDFIVTGVIKDFPKNSHFKFDIIGYDPYEPGDFWTGPLYYTYILLSEDSNVDQLAAKVNKWLATRNTKEQVKGKRYSKLSLQPLRAIHINSTLEDELSKNVSGKILLALSGFAIVILAMAWSNFTNLSIARILGRSKEIYLHRVLGARPIVLILKYGIESAVVNFLAILFSLLVIYLTGPYLEKMVTNVEIFGSSAILVSILSLLVAAGTLIPMLMCLLIFRTQASHNDNRGNQPWKTSWFQRVLIIFQYGMSLLLLIVAGGVFSQMKYISEFNLGFNKNDLLVIKSFNWTEEEWSDSAKSFKVSDAYRKRSEIFAEKIRKYAFVSSVTSLSHVPGENPQWGSEFSVEGMESGNIQPIRCIGVGYQFTATLGVKLLAGRDFLENIVTDRGNENQGAVLVNLATVRNLQLGSPSQALNRVIRTDWGAKYEIVGVIDSYRQVSLRQDVTPLYFRLEPRAMKYYLIKLNNGLSNADLMEIKSQWESNFEGPFEYFFLEDFIESNYADENTLTSLITVFAIAAILISSLGLFAFTTYITAKRKKEIGIRKLLGGSSWQILMILIGSFFRFVLISMIIAIPLSYYFLENWRNQFSVKAGFSMITYLIPVLLILIVTLVSVTYESWKASSANPIDSIRYE